MPLIRQHLMETTAFTAHAVTQRAPHQVLVSREE